MGLLDVDDNIMKEDFYNLFIGNFVTVEREEVVPIECFNPSHKQVQIYKYVLEQLWAPRFDDGEQYLLGNGNKNEAASLWNDIIEETRKALTFEEKCPFARALMYPFLPVYPNFKDGDKLEGIIRLEKEPPCVRENGELYYDGKLGTFTYGPKSRQDLPYITLYINPIRKEADSLGIPFDVMASYVLVHELAHFVMYDPDHCPKWPLTDFDKLNEESAAESIALMCMRQALKDSPELHEKLCNRTNVPGLMEYNAAKMYYESYRNNDYRFGNPQTANDNAGLGWYVWMCKKKLIY